MHEMAEEDKMGGRWFKGKRRNRHQLQGNSKTNKHDVNHIQMLTSVVILYTGIVTCLICMVVMVVPKLQTIRGKECNHLLNLVQFRFPHRTRDKQSLQLPICKSISLFSCNLIKFRDCTVHIGPTFCTVVWPVGSSCCSRDTNTLF